MQGKEQGRGGVSLELVSDDRVGGGQQECGRVGREEDRGRATDLGLDRKTT